jgi:hypothetical protein
MYIGTLVFVVGDALLWAASARWQVPPLVLILLASLLGAFTIAWDMGWRTRR